MFSNTRFAIGVHVLTAIALSGGETVSSRALAQSVKTNPAFLRTVIGQLRRAGLVETRLGKSGGASLARDPVAITLLDVYEAVESGPVMGTHSCDQGQQCVVALGIPRVLDELSGRVFGAVSRELSETTISDVVAQVSA